MRGNIIKLYIANFFIGLIFWYGIEKLFMLSIGIDAVGIALVISVLLAFNFLFDIPSGILADRWSRKGTLVVGLLSMIVCCLILGSANSLAMYIVGYGIFYGIYVVATSGTLASIVYDLLHQDGKSQEYSKVIGQMNAMYLGGIVVAETLSGFLAHQFDFRFTYFLTIASCVVAIAILATVKESKFHKDAQHENAFKQLAGATKTIAQSKMIRTLIIILSALTIVQMFKNSFGQLYLGRYVSDIEIIGLLWAGGALMWAIGNLVAHLFRTWLNMLIVLNVAPLVLMAFIDSWFAIALFMIQHIAMGAFFNQTETRIQEATPSSVRSSVLSVLSSFGRAVIIPASFAIGWVIKEYDVFWALRVVTIVAVLTLLFWWWQHYVRKLKDI